MSHADPTVHFCGQFGKLDPVIAALRHPLIVKNNTVCYAVRLECLGKDIREVDLALIVIGPYVHQRIAQEFAIKCVDPSINFANLTLCFRCIFLFDNPADITACLITDDPPVAGGIIDNGRQH